MITKEQALAALDSMDDYARMNIGVDPYGPRELIRTFIEQETTSDDAIIYMFNDEQGNTFAAVVDSEAYDHYKKLGYSATPQYSRSAFEQPLRALIKENESNRRHGTLKQQEKITHVAEYAANKVLAEPSSPEPKETFREWWHGHAMYELPIIGQPLEVALKYAFEAGQKNA